MSFRDWSGDDIARLLENDGFNLPEGITDEELRDFAEEHYGDVENALRSHPSFREFNEGAEQFGYTDAPIIEQTIASFEDHNGSAAHLSHGSGSFRTGQPSSAIVVPDDDEKGGGDLTDIQAAVETQGPGALPPSILRNRTPHHRRGFDASVEDADQAEAFPGWEPRDQAERLRNEQDDEARYDLAFGEVQDDNFAEPSLEAAREYANLHHPRTMDGRPYPVCTSTMGRFCFRTGPIGVGFDWLGEGAVSEMARYGPGLSLHFKAQKFLFWMFLFSTFISLPQLILNTQNLENGGGLFVTTIGNLFALSSNRSYVFLCASSSATNGSLSSYLCRYSVSELSFIYSFTNLGVISLFIAGLLWIQVFVYREPSQVGKLFLSLDKYSVLVRKVPEGCGEIPLAQYFEEITNEPVEEVNIAYDEGDLITLFKERGNVLSELWRTTGRALQVSKSSIKSTTLRSEEELIDFKMEKLEKVVDYFDLLLTTYHTLNEETRGFRHKGARAICAIVTFETRQGALKALQVFSRARIPSSTNRCRYWLFRGMKKLRRLICCLFFSASLAAKPSEALMDDDEPLVPPFQGIDLICDPAPPPSTILWENLEYNTISRIWRQLLATVLVCIALAASFGASFGAQAYRAELRLSRVSDCNSTSNVSSIVNDCICAGYGFARASSAIFEGNDPCHAYWAERAPLFGFTIFATAVIAFVNFAVTHVTINLTQFERHHSIMSTQLSVAIRLLVAYIVNTAFVYIIVNVVLGGSSQYELSADWYSDVGTQVLITMLLNIITPHLVTVYELTAVCLRRRCGDKPLLQRELNERFVGPEFPFAVRSAQMLLLTFVCLVFGPGMPLLYPIAAVSLGLTFYVDKWTVLRFYRTPPEYDSRMANVLIMVVWTAIIGNLCFAIMAYSAPGLFWNGETTANTGPGIIVVRATLQHTIPLFILLLFSASIWIASYTVWFTWKSVAESPRKSVRKSRRRKRDIVLELDMTDELPPLYEAQRSGYLRGLKSYNILQNPVYRRAFGVPRSFCDEHSHVSSVLALPGGNVLPELPDDVRRMVEEY